jgi:HEAT repeat protein
MGLLRRNRREDVPDTSVFDQPAASLTDPDPARRRQAVQALGGEPGAVDTLIALVKAEPDNSVRQAAFCVLSALDCRAAAEGAASLLVEADPALRNGAHEVLAAMPQHALALLEPLGRHTDPDVRAFAILIAADLPAEAAGDWLIGLAHCEADPNVCAHLADALGGSGLPGAADALAAIAARFGDTPFVGFAVQIALRRLGAA